MFSEANNLPIAEVAFETCIFLCVFVIFGKISLFLFRTYFFISNSSVEGDEEGISSKAPEIKPWFWLKMKIKQNPGCPNKD